MILPIKGILIDDKLETHENMALKHKEEGLA